MIMEFYLLYLKYLFIIQFFCVSLEEINIVKFVRKKQPTPLECIAQQKVEYWHIKTHRISSPDWLPIKTNEFEANVVSGKTNVLNITLFSNNDLTLSCQGTDKKIKYQAIPLYNDNRNLYPSSETPNAIKDKKFTLKCNTMGTGTTVIWYTGNGTVIAKYIGLLNQNFVKYFGSRQETSCQHSSCTLSITNISLDEDNMDIICKGGLHTSKYSITVFDPPQVNIHISNETNNITINCTAFDGNPAIYEYKLKQKWGNSTKNTYNINVLSIKNSTFNNTGTWECHVSNEYFHVIKSSSYKIPVKPIFSLISRDPKKRNVSIGDSVIFKQCFYSHPKSEVKWQKNEKLIDSNKYLTTDYLSSEFPFKGSCTSLKIEDIKDSDFGTYTLMVENPIGKKIIIFTMRFKEIMEVSLRIIIGCSVGIVLLIILAFLAYKCHKKRGVKHNKKDKIGTNPLEEINASLAGDMEGDYATISSESSNVERVYATISIEPNNEEDQYAETSDPRYLCMRHLDVDGAYDNISKKPDTVEEQYTEVNESKYLEMKQRNMDGTYVNISKKPGVTKY